MGAAVRLVGRRTNLTKLGGAIRDYANATKMRIY